MRRMLVICVPLVLFNLAAFSQTSDTDTITQKKNYFVVQYSTGSAWDHAKQPHEQKFFKEHSQLLATLRKSAVIVLGARYSDKGFLVVKAFSEEEARSYFAADPSVENKTFEFALFPFGVFYGGCVEK